MFASASGELYTRAPPNSFCSPHVTLKTPPLPLTLPQVLSRDTSATSSPKTRICRIAPHLVLHARVEQVDHRRLVARELRIVFGVELLARGIDVGRIDVRVNRFRRRAAAAASASSVAAEHLGVDFLAGSARSRLRSRGPRRPATSGTCVERIARRVGFALFRRAIHALRRRTANASTDESRARARARALCACARSRPRARMRLVARDEIAAVHLLDVQIRERPLRASRSMPPARVHLDRNRDRVAVVLDEVDDRAA